MEQINTLPVNLEKMPQRIPTNGTFELTVRCNLHCKMCLFRHNDSENKEIIANELTAEQWIDMAKQVAEAGTMSLLITGGEPMLRPDFCEIWEGIYKQGFITELYTNATLVTPQIMETLRKYPPHRIGISIYGASPETYDKVCGNSSAFQKAIAGIHQLQTLPSLLELRTTIIKDNYADVCKMEQLLKDEFHYESELIETRIVMNSVRGACTDVISCRLDAKDNISLMMHRSIDEINQKAQKQGKSIIDYKVHIQPKEKNMKPDVQSNMKPTLLGCNAGMRSYVISWDGKLLACQILDKFSVNVIRSTFIKEWENLPYQFELPVLCKKCRECKHLDICPACPASRYAETGDMGGCAEYLCEDVAELLKFIH